MRFEGTRPSGKDKDIPVYLFSVGKEECKVLYELAKTAHKNVPDIIELQQYRHRLGNLKKIFWQILKNI